MKQMDRFINHLNFSYLHHEISNYCRKPSVATDLSRALSQNLANFKREKSRDAQYFTNDNAAITSAVGHLVELKMPTGPNGKKLPWNFNVLPAIPKNLYYSL